jgi:hypothetical protein
VRNFRCEYQIAIYREGERVERREPILNEAANRQRVNKDDRRSLTDFGVVGRFSACC